MRVNETVGQAFCFGFCDRCVRHWFEERPFPESPVHNVSYHLGWLLASALGGSAFHLARRSKPLTTEQLRYGLEVADRIEAAAIGGQPPQER